MTPCDEKDEKKEETRLLIEKTAMFEIREDMTISGSGLVFPGHPFSSPVAFWDADVNCWCVVAEGHGPLRIQTFRPFFDMNDAWNVLRYAAGGKGGHLARREILSSSLFGTSNYQVYLIVALGAICAWTPQMICEAVLRAYGVEGV